MRPITWRRSMDKRVSCAVVNEHRQSLHSVAKAHAFSMRSVFVVWLDALVRNGFARDLDHHSECVGVVRYVSEASIAGNPDGLCAS